MLRYYSLRSHLKEVFDEPVSKICVDAGFTCPNRDGSKGYCGCIYCNERGSGSPAIDRLKTVDEQIEKGIELIKKHSQNPKYIIYFQAFSNTYSSVTNLEKLYRSALKQTGAVGLSIGTRPDCVSPEILDLIKDISAETYLWLEFGVETIHDHTLEIINRKHNYSDFLKAYRHAKERNIKICLHVIIGLPGETNDEILSTAETIGQLEPDGIKIHSLYIEKDTQLYNLYLKSPWPLFTLDEYSEIAAEFLEYLPETTVIHRLTGKAIPDRLFLPVWLKNKQIVLNSINNKLIEWNSAQGRKYKPRINYK